MFLENKPQPTALTQRLVQNENGELVTPCCNLKDWTTKLDNKR